MLGVRVGLVAEMNADNQVAAEAFQLFSCSKKILNYTTKSHILLSKMLHFVELSPFRNYLDQLSDGQTVLEQIQDTLLRQPDIGDIVQGTGGIRKMRAAGKGKSGGFRVWYLYFFDFKRIYLMAIYSKNETEDLSQADRKYLKTFVDHLKAEAKNEKK